MLKKNIFFQGETTVENRPILLNIFRKIVQTLFIKDTHLWYLSTKLVFR